MKHFKTQQISALALTALMLAVNGCSSLGIGEDEFACPGKPGSPLCKSSWELYEMTSNGNAPGATQMQNEDAEPSDSEEEGEKHAGYVNTNDADFIVDNYVAPRLPDRPVPVRTPSRVMRIWFAPYDDTEGDFIVSGYAYTEIEPRRWTLGVADTNAATGRVFEPLKATNRNFSGN